MMTRKIAIDVPESVLLAEKTDERSFARELRTLTAVKLYELGRLSSERAAELAGMARVEFLLTLNRYRVFLWRRSWLIWSVNVAGIAISSTSPLLRLHRIGAIDSSPGTLRGSVDSAGVPESALLAETDERSFRAHCFRSDVMICHCRRRTLTE